MQELDRVEKIITKKQALILLELVMQQHDEQMNQFYHQALSNTFNRFLLKLDKELQAEDHNDSNG